jgi:hypothetical protein
MIHNEFPHTTPLMAMMRGNLLNVNALAKFYANPPPASRRTGDPIGVNGKCEPIATLGE